MTEDERNALERTPEWKAYEDAKNEFYIAVRERGGARAAEDDLDAAVIALVSQAHK